MKTMITALAISALVLLVPYPAFAPCLLITKKGHMWSGPGTNYKIVRELELGEIICGYLSFPDNPDKQWIRESSEYSILGYVNKSLGKLYSYRSEAIEELEREKREKELKLLFQSHPEWPDHIKQRIRQKKIGLGMTKEQAEASWGRPDDINRTVSRSGVREQWIYGDVFVYFEDGKLSAWQD